MTNKTPGPCGPDSSTELGWLAPGRVAFEAWCSRQGWAESDLADKCAEGAPRAGEYRDVFLQDYWEIWQAAATAARERWRELLRTPHRMAGGCPDEVAGHDSRDLDCHACRLMQELGA